MKSMLIAAVAVALTACTTATINQPEPAVAKTETAAAEKIAAAESTRMTCEPTTGSRLNRKKVCYTEEQRKAIRENSRSAVEGAQNGVLTERGSM